MMQVNKYKKQLCDVAGDDVRQANCTGTQPNLHVMK